MGHLLPQVARGPEHRVQHPVDPFDMAPAAATALRAEQLLQPFVAEHQHRIGLDHQLRPVVAHAPSFQLFRREQMQEILLPVALDPLLRMGWAEQLPLLRPAVTAGLICVRCVAQAGRYSDLFIAAQWAPPLGHEKALLELAGPNYLDFCTPCIACLQAEPTPT
jgi:hypothetical protein